MKSTVQGKAIAHNWCVPLIGPIDYIGADAIIEWNWKKKPNQWLLKISIIIEVASRSMQAHTPNGKWQSINITNHRN